ncbi:ATP-binding cassette domain-containing protein [uncultured Croceitalea sp.]|uniref:ATP-binding cassette domain-containing protein n=1 Tax=uncultured Croceitalea sp. TaxID=1798908 RepID=UPI003305778A
MKHAAIRIDHQSQIKPLLAKLLQGKANPILEIPDNTKGAVFSSNELEKYIDEEERHGIRLLTKHKEQSLKSMSSGEQKKALLTYLLQQNPSFLVLINPYDNLDQQSQNKLEQMLLELSNKFLLVQFLSRTKDILPFTKRFFYLKTNELVPLDTSKDFHSKRKSLNVSFRGEIPKPLDAISLEMDTLVEFNAVSVSFDNRPVLVNINWTIKKGEFWQLTGPNGSGKSTLLNMIVGDSHKGYGQDLTLFGMKKGSGESVWDIKYYIGYFTPAMLISFKGYDTLKNMLMAALHDAIGLYVKPSESEKNLALKWLALLGLDHKKEVQFRQISEGEKRLVMTARAMIKHPPLLILDEPTIGLDDLNAAKFVALVNKMAKETGSTIIYVSHRNEQGLLPKSIYELTPAPNGATGKIK